jgi:hypothetical protein
LRKGGIGDFGGQLPTRLSQQILSTAARRSTSGNGGSFGSTKPDDSFALQSIDRSINPISSVQKWPSSPNLDAAKKGESPVKP